MVDLLAFLTENHMNHLMKNFRVIFVNMALHLRIRNLYGKDFTLVFT
jgi:hypothetical protein